MEVGLAPGYVSALGGGHVYGALSATPPATVPSGAPFPFAGVSNVPGFTITTKAPIQTAAPKTNVGIPYARSVPTVFAQKKKNLVTACAGDPVFLSKRTPMVRGDVNRYTYVCSVEYLNEKLAEPENAVAPNAALTPAASTVRTALLEQPHKDKLARLNDLMETENRKRLPDEAKLNAYLAEFNKETEDYGKATAATTFDPNLDFFSQVPALGEWRLDGVLRSIDMDGTPLVDRRTGTEMVHNTSDVSTSTLLNVIVQGPARVRISDGIGYDEKWTYAAPGRGRHRVSVFDELILALVKKTTEDGKFYYQVQRSTRSYEQERDPATSAFTATKTVYEGLDADDMVGYWRLGRVLEEPNKVDRMCGVNFSGEFVLLRDGAEIIV